MITMPKRYRWPKHKLQARTRTMRDEAHRFMSLCWEYQQHFPPRSYMRELDFYPYRRVALTRH